jgi:hypothetical protein
VDSYIVTDVSEVRSECIFRVRLPKKMATGVSESVVLPSSRVKQSKVIEEGTTSVINP